MQKWNMIIDVAECTNCQLCALSAMDEYVGNEWPGVSAPMPRNGHRWIDILQKERGQVPMIDIAYVPTMCNHCDNAPCLAKGGDAVKKRDDGIVIIDPVKAKGRKDLVESCPYGHIWWNEEAAASADLAVRRASARPGLETNPRPAGLPDRRDQSNQSRRRGDDPHRPRRKSRSAETRSQHQTPRLLPQPLALLEMLHRRQRLN